MSFLSPWFLLGALAVGIPIWLHLVRREQPNRVPFSSLMFFRRMPVKSVARQRLKYLLLLATRILIILLIALAFARPYFPSLAGAFTGSEGQKNVVILLDNSLSMQYGNRWQRALSAARDAIAGLGARDRAQIVTFSSDYQIQNLPSSEKPVLRSILDRGLHPTASTTSYAQASRAVEKIGEDLGQPVSVVLISDLQKSGMEKLPPALSGGPVAGFKLVDVADGDAPNWTIAGARSHRVIYRSRYPDRLLVEVRGFGTPSVSRDVTLSLGGKVVGRKKVQVPASGTVTVAFDGFDVPPGNNRGEIALAPSDNLPQDDVFHFVLERREPYRILFLHEPGQARELYYVRSALAAEPDSPFTVAARTPAEAASVHLQDYAMVILSNVAELPRSVTAGLKDFVKQGSGMLVTLGDQFPAPALEKQLKEIWPGRSIAKRVMTPEGDRMVLLGQFEKEHPLFREFQDAGAAESLRSAEFFAYVRVQPDSQVLARFSNGDPALLEKQYGRGRVLLFASSFDNVWSDFPLHPAFIPLLHRMVRYVAQLPDEPPAYTIPAAVSLVRYKSAAEAPARGKIWDVIGPDGKRAVPLEQKLRPDFLMLRQAGFYQLRQRDNSHLIAANIDPRESDLTQLSAQDRALWTASASNRQTGAAALMPGAAKRQSIWWSLLLVAFLLGLVEAYLANQYLGVRSTTASSEQIKEDAYAG